MNQADVNAHGSQQVLAALGEAPVIKLKSGIWVANFSSPHPFRFITGEELPACSDERARWLMLEAEETTVPNAQWEDIHLNFRMSAVVEEELVNLCKNGGDDLDVDLVLVPLPVRVAVRAETERRVRSFGSTECLGDWVNVHRKTRTIRVADRVKKVIYSDRFCV